MVAVAEHPERDDVVGSIQCKFRRDQIGGVVRRVGIGIESSHVLAFLMRHIRWCGTAGDAIVGIGAAVDIVLPAKGHKVVLEAFHQRVAGDGFQGSDLKVSTMCQARGRRRDIKGSMQFLIVG